MEVRWLRLHLSMLGLQVQSLIRELKCHMPSSQNTKTLNRNNIVTNLIDLKKIVHIEKKKATEF